MNSMSVSRRPELQLMKVGDRYIAAQEWGECSRDSQTKSRVAHNVTDESTPTKRIYRVVGIYPRTWALSWYVLRTAEWRIVPKLLAVEPLTLKSGIAAPRILSITVGWVV